MTYCGLPETLVNMPINMKNDLTRFLLSRLIFTKISFLKKNKVYLSEVLLLICKLIKLHTSKDFKVKVNFIYDNLKKSTV